METSAGAKVSTAKSGHVPFLLCRAKVSAVNVLFCQEVMKSSSSFSSEVGDAWQLQHLHAAKRLSAH